MKKSDLSFLLVRRGELIKSDMTMSDLNILLEKGGSIREEEMIFLDEWKRLTKLANVDKFFEYSNKELKGMLELKTIHSFLIPLTFLGKDVKKAMVAYYHLFGFQVDFPEKVFTEEQKSVINDEKKGITVINAGPGTGKTTVANEKGFRLWREGVILISYTNEAIKENYRRLGEYPGLSGNIGKKNPKKKFNITTVDSLAYWIFGKESLDHDLIVQSAIDKLKFNPDSIDRFYIPGRGPLYRHIIVDECQDIDNLRGELIMTFFKTIPGMTLTLFGDPRQRIQDGCGEWYSELWSTGTYKGIESEKVRRVGFSYTYRFLNQTLFSLVNNISKRRDDIHHQLVPHESLEPLPISETPITVISLKTNKDEECLFNLAEYIKKTLHRDHGVPYGNIAVIGPSMDRGNLSSFQCKRVCDIFNLADVPCYTRSDGAYHPRGILFSTIHSIKGKEFDYVFLFGMSDYPSTFSMIQHNAGESLVYVAHTRARKKMYYIAYDNFVLPRGVEQIFVENYDVPQNFSNRRRTEPEQENHDIVSLSSDYSFQRFIIINAYTAEIVSFDEKDEVFSGEISSLDISLLHYLPGGFSHRELDLYKKRIGNENLEIPFLLEEEKGDDRLLNFLLTGKDNPNISIEVVKTREIIDSLVRDFGQVEVVNSTIKRFHIKASVHLEFKNHLAIIGSGSINPFHLQLLRVLTGKIPIFVSLNGKRVTVKSNRDIDHWNYIIPAYVQIRRHVNLTRFRQSIAIEKGFVSPKFDKNTFTVDTEFYGLGMKGGMKIFDIAIINVNDPFLSLVQTIKIEGPGLTFAVDWISQPENLFKTSGSISDVYELFKVIVHRSEGSDVNLLNYMCSVDVDWCQQGFAINLGSATRKIALERGYFSSGSQPPKLTDIYSLVSSPLEFQPHIRPHTAVSDALILYEMIHLGHISPYKDCMKTSLLSPLGKKIPIQKSACQNDSDIMKLLGI